jgi:hypothetical protein
VLLFIYSLIYLFAVLGLEPKVSHLLPKSATTWAMAPASIFNSFFFSWLYWGLNSGPTPWATPPALFCDGFFFKIGSLKLFAGAGFELWFLISASWVARIIGVSPWHPAFNSLQNIKTFSHCVSELCLWRILQNSQNIIDVRLRS